MHKKHTPSGLRLPLPIVPRDASERRLPAGRYAGDLDGSATCAPPCRSATLRCATCAPPVSQRDTLGAHVRTHHVATRHPRCPRAHTPCRNATPPVRHVRTPRVAALHPRCARAHTPCRNATPSVRTRTPDAPQRDTPGANPHRPLTNGLNRPISIVAKSKIVRFSTLAAVGGMGVLDSTSVLYRCGS